MIPRQTTTQERHQEFQADQRDFFDELITREWNTYVNADWDASRQFEVTELFRHVQPETILDVGCGCGYHDLLMARQANTQRVYAIDYSVKSIETANRVYSHEKADRQVGDINALPADIPRVDLAVSFQVIEHTTDPSLFLANCAAQVKPGGHVAIFTPNRLRASNRLRRALGRQEKLSDPQHFMEFSVDELSSLGRSNGLEPITSFGYGMDLPLLRSGLPMRWRLALGKRLPGCADGICVIFRAPGDRAAAGGGNA